MVANRSKELWAALVAVGLGLASLLALGWLQARPRGGEQVAAIFPPWTDREAAFTQVLAAGGLVVRQGALDTILVVHGDDPRLIDRLYAAGAWAVADPQAFGGCLLGRPRVTT